MDFLAVCLVRAILTFAMCGVIIIFEMRKGESILFEQIGDAVELKIYIYMLCSLLRQ